VPDFYSDVRGGKRRNGDGSGRGGSRDRPSDGADGLQSATELYYHSTLYMYSTCRDIPRDDLTDDESPTCLMNGQL
ncbi:hypothetical protein GWI33_004027, partial [Rhynchophorus ferrugineus]